MFIMAAVLLATFSQHDVLESELLDARHDAFRADEGTLMIVTTQGDTLVFQNNEDPPHGLKSSMYKLVDHLPELNFWTVKVMGYEFIDWQTVNGETGEITTTIGPGLPSPDNTRLLCMNEDIHAGFDLNGIQIWRIGPNRSLTLEFEDTSVPWGPISGTWVNDSTISFVKLSYDYDTFDYTTEKGKLKLFDGIWTPPDPEDWDW